MPAVHSKLHTLSLLSNQKWPEEPYQYPTEREISRAALVDVAPDREDMLTTKSIEEIRQVLKLRVNMAYGHWLFCSQKRQEVKLKDDTTRFSVFGRLASTNNDTVTASEMGEKENQPPIRVIRRVLSASSIYPMGNPAGRNNRRDQIWGGPLSTQEKLVSPRPLGATHILVAYAMVPGNVSVSSKGTLRPKRRKALAAPTFSEVVEVPINDLLFVLNVPNLMLPRDQTSASILPRRLHKEMPRVLMHVPHLESFPELIVYLHTKNQAALFRGLIPEWIRDIMHPLPAVSIADVKIVEGANGSTAVLGGLGVRKLLGKLVAGSSSTSSLNTVTNSSRSSLLTIPEQLKEERTLLSISLEIAEVAGDLEEEDTTLLDTAALLNALRDNLGHLGYFNRGLWLELDLCRDIILGAIRHQSRMAKPEDETEGDLE